MSVFPKLIRIAVPVACSLLLSSCLIGLGSSTVTTTATSTNYKLNFTATLSTCTPVPLAPNGITVSCHLQVSGGPSWTITANLPGIAPASLPPLFDPVILQVPQSAGNFSGTITGPGGGALSVTPVTESLMADSTTPIVAEPGYQLVVIDFAPGASLSTGVQYAFQLDFSIPNPAPTSITAKVLFAGKVVTGSSAVPAEIVENASTTYYPPLLPCSANFANIPGVTIAASSPVNVLPLLSAQPCNNVTYNFAAVAPSTPVTVVEYYNASLNHYFITWIANEIAILDAGVTIKGWTRTGQTLKAYATAQAGTSEVCRFYIPPGLGDSHFFGRGTTECNDTRTKFPSFVLEDPLYMHVFLPAAGVCPAGTTQIYRVFSNRPDANHRYMTSSALRDQMVAMGWLAEGDGPDQVVMCAPA